MKRRTFIKALHWLTTFLILWFFLVEPEDVRQLGPLALATHAGMGVTLGIIVAIWFTMYWQKGLAGRAGPKLPGWGKTFHLWLHRALYWGVPAMVATGATTGFSAPYVIRAFGLFPINVGFGNRNVQDLLADVHEVAFNMLIFVVGAHVAFHLWRHYFLRDNALRIMVPKVFHRFL